MKGKIEEYTPLIKKTKLPETWETLPELKPTVNLGQYILDKYLRKSGDVIEVDLSDKTRKQGLTIRRALGVIAQKQKITLLFRYSSDFNSLYVKRE